MNTSWADRAKSRMHAQGITQRALAAALSCTRGAVGHYLAGRRMPSLQQLELLAAALEVSPAWLLYGIDTEVREGAAAYAGAAGDVPVMGNTAAGLHGGPTAWLHLPAAAAGCYAVTVADYSYTPRARPGELLLVDPRAPAVPGDEVFVVYRDGTTGYHILRGRGRDGIRLESVAGEKHLQRIAPETLRTLHRVLAVFRGGVSAAAEPAGTG